MSSRLKLFIVLAAVGLKTTCALSQEALQEVTVKSGDTLWKIASIYLQDPKRWPDILKYNNLPATDPMVALPGMKLKVPIQLIKEHLRKADLVLVRNEVRYRRKEQAAWKNAAKGLDLYNEDGLRTLESAQAHVRFYGGNVLKLDENSLVVLRPELKREEVNLLVGALQTSRSKVITPTAEVSPQTEDTVYKARIRDDKATIVQVEQGSAEVLGLDTGKKVTVPAGHANITISKQAPSLPVRVPKMADLQIAEFSATGELLKSSKPPLKPAVAEVGSTQAVLDKAKAPELLDPRVGPMDYEAGTDGKGKRKTKDWVSFRIQASRDPRFQQVVYDQKKPMGREGPAGEDPSKYGLSDGKYYLRVSYFDAAGAETSFYGMQSFEVDTQPPQLTITFPPEGYKTKEGLVNIEGQTETGCFLIINNYPVPVKSDGKFYWSAVLVNAGANKVKILVRDKNGNRTQQERTIFYSGK